MPKKVTLTFEQIEKLRKLAATGDYDQIELGQFFGISDQMVRKLSKENNITLRRKQRTYTCVVCNNEFRAERPTAICPKCKATPAKCVICGKEFVRKQPYTQKTCSEKCRGLYRAQSGIGKEGAAKMKQTKLARYGTLDPTAVVKAKSGSDVLKTRTCKCCGKEFIPETPWQMYCKDDHYGACPVCGGPTLIKDFSIGPQACSEKCRMARINATCLKLYGNKDAVNSEHARELGRQTSIKNWGYEYYMQSPEGKARFRKISLEKFGTEYPMQNKDVQAKGRATSLNRYGKEYYSQTDEGKAKIKQTMNDNYGGFPLEHTSTLRKKYEDKMMEEYGVTAPMNSPVLVERLKSNNTEKYGSPWGAATSDEANAKRKATNLERYRAENVFGSKEIQAKSRETCIEKYGVPNAMYNPELARLTSERQQQSMINKYGVNASVLVPEIKEKIIATNMERYGVPWYGMSQEFILRSISKINQKFAADLGHLNVLTDFEFQIDTKRYDLKVHNSNIVIEIDPTYTHNSYSAPFGDPHEPNYHLTKTQLADDNGYRCIHVFDWDDSLAIFNLLKSKTRIYARKCSLLRIDRATAELFTAKYHLQGSCRGQNIAYGLYYKGELVQLMSFGKPRYNKNYDFELLRLCTQTGIEVVGGPSRLFKHFLKDNPGKSVLSYCDYAKFNGKVYEAIGMKLSHMTPPAKVWSKDSEYITDNYLRQRGYDQIFKANYGKGTSNEQLMLEHGWLPVYDCGQKVFVYQPAVADEGGQK